ncbi:MAG: 3'-5' exonuclease [Myxococcota bacterium]
MSDTAPPQTSQSPTSASLPSIVELGPRFATFVENLARPVIFFDIEATGTDPVSDRIVELCVVRVGPPPMWIETPRTWRVNPQTRIPAEASEIHGIYNEDLASAPSFADVAQEIAGVFEGADLAGFSIGRFDVRILAAELLRAGIDFDPARRRVIDSQVIYHIREPRNLTAALQYYRGRELTNAHGAEADTVASLEVFAGQLERYSDLPSAVDGLHAASAAHNDAYCDGNRRFAWRDNEPVFNFGRMRGKSLRWVAADPEERKYLRWFLEGTFEEDAKSIVREALVGRIRSRQPSAASARPR